jgi:hypothetical protein
MSQKLQGQFIFNTNTERDMHGKHVEDFIESKLNVMPHPDSAYTVEHAGVEYRNNMTIDTDSGPGFIFSMRLPEDEPLLIEAAAVVDGINAIALNGLYGFASIQE